MSTNRGVPQPSPPLLSSFRVAVSTGRGAVLAQHVARQRAVHVGDAARLVEALVGARLARPLVR